MTDDAFQRYRLEAEDRMFDRFKGHGSSAYPFKDLYLERESIVQRWPATDRNEVASNADDQNDLDPSPDDPPTPPPRTGKKPKTETHDRWVETATTKSKEQKSKNESRYGPSAMARHVRQQEGRTKSEKDRGQIQDVATIRRVLSVRRSEWDSDMK